ncbi:glycoside hydrolase family 31 protein [Clostridium sp. Marseille-P2415]|uniref:glycoside hydrolase family 31 protein n=1 Tax=Clostridium sp. Marseille-P2415 TaxID=1805471 RepID=UPI0009882EAE|nr:TIM-barrel domain-containing protein [Clostridium sp. Marseille-P2415]
MIKKYTYGTPVQTDAVVKNIVPETDKCPYEQNHDPLIFRLLMEEDDIVYGLGEQVRGINKRGWRYVSYCSDEPHHQEDKQSLYGAHNFFVLKGRLNAGIFVDFPGKITFDIGFKKLEEIQIIPEGTDLDIYIIEGGTVPAIIKEFRELIGPSYIPPLWAFGYGQSRWGYKSADDIRTVAKRYRESQIPIDSIYLDIDYMDRYKDFTIDKEAFPDFPDFVKEMKEQKIHLVPIIDAGVKIEPGYDVYEEGSAGNYFCKDEEGNDFVTAVWPGRTHFPDVLNDKAREWFGSKYRLLLEQGIDGFWNDMNEPAIFYTDVHLKEAFEEIEQYKQKDNLVLKDWFAFQELIRGIPNSEKDYKRFYHNIQGKKVRHDQVHNLYGYYMTRAAGEAFEKYEPEKRILMFSRSSYIGMHRYGGVWTGDNKSWWSHLLLNIQMMPSLNMCGFLYTGADIGGFGADTTEDLIKRWLAFGVFTPLMRNHSAMGTREQELYQFRETEGMRKLIEARYQLLPYLYSEFMKAALENELFFRPLSFDYPEDEMALQTEDQLLVGESLMIAPVYIQNAKGRNVYLPEDMKMVTLGEGENLNGTVLEKGWHYIGVPMDSIVFFLRPDHILPLSKGGRNVEEVDFVNLKLVSYVKTEAFYRYYHDDGYGKDYRNPNNYRDIRL